jgi:single-strand DNA-binding protein
MATRTQTAVAPAAPQQDPIASERIGSGERGLNKCLFIGRLGADPELRYTPAGIPVATASLAVKSYPGAPGPDWIKLRFWRGAAETVAQYASKGSKLHIEGKLRVGHFTDQDGVPRTTFVIDVDEFLFLGAAAHPANSPTGTTTEVDTGDLSALAGIAA